MPEAIVIPPVPSGIVDPANLYNDAYKDLDPLRWDSVGFHEKLAWLEENQPFTIKEWYASRNSSPQTSFLCQTMYRAVLPNAHEYECDCRNVEVYPSALLYSLECVAGTEGDTVPQYPGYDARHPKGGSSPIGAPLSPQPWRGRTLYADLGGDQYAVGEEYKAENGDRYAINVCHTSPRQRLAEQSYKTRKSSFRGMAIVSVTTSALILFAHSLRKKKSDCETFRLN
jgi:hypothetical protein